MTRDEVPEVGTLCEVEFKDCCVAGSFTSRLQAVGWDEREPDQVTALRFENGVTLTEFLAVDIVPIAQPSWTPLRGPMLTPDPRGGPGATVDR